MEHIAIAIYGPAGSGKSTVAKEVARRLGITYLDTGAMYRSVALKALESGIDPRDRERVAALLPHTDIRVTVEDGVQRFYLDGEDVTADTHARGVPGRVGRGRQSRRAQLSGRDAAKNRRGAGRHHGRPRHRHARPARAPYKFFMTADPRVRAQRRHSELLQKGSDKTLEDVYNEMVARDANDAGRECAPLRQAEDAELLDTTKMTIDEAVEHVLKRVRP